MSNTGIKHITYFWGLYIVRKRIKGKTIYFARFKTLKEAKTYVEYCIKNNWSLKCKKRIRNHLKELKYISNPQPNYYQVKKTINSKSVHYGSFTTLEDAKKFRDYCVEHNWSNECKIRKVGKYDLPKYVSYNKAKKCYVILKKDTNGQVIFHANYRHLEDAKKERDLLIRYDWDEDKLMEHDEAYGSIWE